MEGAFFAGDGVDPSMFPISSSGSDKTVAEYNRCLGADRSCQQYRYEHKMELGDVR